MFSLRSPGSEQLNDFVQTERICGVLSYSEVGRTRGDLPPGYRHDRWQCDLGPDDGDRFDRAASALREWAPQKGAGLRVVPAAPVAHDLTFALVLRAGLLWVMAGARVIYVTEEQDRWGFAYGTLVSHPEQGEEYFGVVRDSGRVHFEIVAFSRPRHPLARLGAPATRYLQVRTTRRYMEAMQRTAE
jgi:uncharacterized protein (UPF0548 family)